jgi:hypothetical protein
MRVGAGPRTESPGGERKAESKGEHVVLNFAAQAQRRVSVKSSKLDDFQMDLNKRMTTVQGRNPSQRYGAKRGVRGRSRQKKNPQAFTEVALEMFFGSLDERLFPSALAGDEAAEDAWSEFWESRTTFWAAFIRRWIDETKAATGRTLDLVADQAELLELEREIVRKLRPGDKRALRVFIGKMEVGIDDLTDALWRSHADAWLGLSRAPSVRACVAGLGATVASDPRTALAREESQNSSAPTNKTPPERKAAPAPRDVAPPSIRIADRDTIEPTRVSHLSGGFAATGSSTAARSRPSGPSLSLYQAMSSRGSTAPR